MTKTVTLSTAVSEFSEQVTAGDSLYVLVDCQHERELSMLVVPTMPCIAMVSSTATPYSKLEVSQATAVWNVQSRVIHDTKDKRFTFSAPVTCVRIDAMHGACNVDGMLVTQQPAAGQDLSAYALKTDIPMVPDLSGYALKVDLAPYAKSADLWLQYATHAWVNSQLDDINGLVNSLPARFALKTELPAAPNLTPLNLGSADTVANGYNLGLVRPRSGARPISFSFTLRDRRIATLSSRKLDITVTMLDLTEGKGGWGNMRYENIFRIGNYKEFIFADGAVMGALIQYMFVPGGMQLWFQDLHAGVWNIYGRFENFTVNWEMA